MHIVLHSRRYMQQRTFIADWRLWTEYTCSRRINTSQYEWKNQWRHNIFTDLPIRRMLGTVHWICIRIDNSDSTGMPRSRTHWTRIMTSVHTRNGSTGGWCCRQDDVHGTPQHFSSSLSAYLIILENAITFNSNYCVLLLSLFKKDLYL